MLFTLSKTIHHHRSHQADLQHPDYGQLQSFVLSLLQPITESLVIN